MGVNGINHSENPKDHRRWFADKALAGGGAVMDHTVHLADLLRWYFDAEVVEVYAQVDNPFCRTEVEVDSAGLILATLSNGVIASIDCSWSRPRGYPRWGITLPAAHRDRRTPLTPWSWTAFGHH